MPVSGFPARRTRLRAGFQQSAGAAALAGAGALFSDGEIVTGVVVSRGVIMPIVDMRIAFGPRPPQHDPLTDVIILKLSSCVMGMVVDGVTDIVALKPEQIEPIAGAGGVDYLVGWGSGRAPLIVVDIDKLMSIRKVQFGARQAARP
jgi:purine-binding chemotaxis protein CheW